MHTQAPRCPRNRLERRSQGDPPAPSRPAPPTRPGPLVSLARRRFIVSMAPRRKREETAGQNARRLQAPQAGRALVSSSPPPRPRRTHASLPSTRQPAAAGPRNLSGSLLRQRDQVIAASPSTSDPRLTCLRCGGSWRRCRSRRPAGRVGPARTNGFAAGGMFWRAFVTSEGFGAQLGGIEGADAKCQAAAADAVLN